MNYLKDCWKIILLYLSIIKYNVLSAGLDFVDFLVTYKNGGADE